MGWKISLIIPLSLGFLLCGYSKASSAPQDIEIVNGIKHIHNHEPQWGDDPKVDLEFVQRIGEPAGDDENYLFYRPRDIALDSGGNIYVLDGGNCRIQMFNTQGKYLSTIGREGRGPAEFTLPVALHIDADDVLYVAEAIGRWVIILSPDGHEIRRVKLTGMFDYVRLTRSKNIVMPSPPVPITDTIAESPLITVLDNEGNVITTFGEKHDYRDPELTYFGNEIDIAMGVEDEIFVTFINQNRIERYTPEGRLLFRADRPINYKLSSWDETIPNETFLFQHKEFTKVSSSIGIDDKGRVWVTTYKKQREEDDIVADYLVYELFDADGVLLSRVDVPRSGWTIIHGNWLFIISLEDYCVYEYRISEKQSMDR